MNGTRCRSVWFGLVRGALYFFIAVFSVSILFQSTYAAQIIFDESHDQSAGNADWVIGSPPDWVGGYSDLGKIARQIGFETKACKGAITKDTLEGVSLLVLPEPNSEYTQEEITTIIDFVKSGGGLLMIADHIDSDRNFDGLDSPKIFNKFSPDSFCIRFNYDYISKDPIEVRGDHPCINGVSKMGTWGGCSMQPGQGSSVLVVDVTAKGPKRSLLTISKVGRGRVVGIGDSSIFEDGTGNKKPSGKEKKLYQTVDKYDHSKLAQNIFRWLSERDQEIALCPKNFKPLEGYPEVTALPPWKRKVADERPK